MTFQLGRVNCLRAFGTPPGCVEVCSRHFHPSQKRHMARAFWGATWTASKTLADPLSIALLPEQACPQEIGLREVGIRLNRPASLVKSITGLAAAKSRYAMPK